MSRDSARAKPPNPRAQHHVMTSKRKAVLGLRRPQIVGSFQLDVNRASFIDVHLVISYDLS